MNNEIEAMENVAGTTARTGLTGKQKAGIIICATVLTCGLAYLGYRIFKGAKARKAAKELSKQEEVHE